MEEKVSLIYRDYIIAHKDDNLYIAKRNDQVDRTLGNYINLYNKKPEREKMKIMFLRESEGVY